MRTLWLVADHDGAPIVESLLTPRNDVRQESRRLARFATSGVRVFDGDPRTSLRARVVRRVRQKGERA